MPTVSGEAICAPVLTVQLTLAALGTIAGLILGIVKYRSRDETGKARREP